MCESNVYLKDDKGEELVMEDVVLIEKKDDGWRLESIIGDETVVSGTIEEITFLDHRIVIRA